MIHEFERWRDEVRATVEARDPRDALRIVLQRCRHDLTIPETASTIGVSWIVRCQLVLDQHVQHCIAVAQPRFTIGKQREMPPLVPSGRYLVVMTRDEKLVREIEDVMLSRVIAKPRRDALPPLPSCIMTLDYGRAELATLAAYLNDMLSMSMPLDEFSRESVRHYLAREFETAHAGPDRDAMQDRIATKLFGDAATPVAEQRIEEVRRTLRQLADTLLNRHPRDPWLVTFRDFMQGAEAWNAALAASHDAARLAVGTKHNTSGLPTGWWWERDEVGGWRAVTSDAVVAWDGEMRRVKGYGALIGIEASDPVAIAVAKRGRFLDSLHNLRPIKLDVESVSFTDGYQSRMLSCSQAEFTMSMRAGSLDEAGLARLREYAMSFAKDPSRYLVLSCHDEIVVEMPEQDTRRASDVLRLVMERYPEIEPFCMQAIDTPARKLFEGKRDPVRFGDLAVPWNGLPTNHEARSTRVVEFAIDGMPLYAATLNERCTPCQTWHEALALVVKARRAGETSIVLDPRDLALLRESFRSRCRELCGHDAQRHDGSCPLRTVSHDRDMLPSRFAGVAVPLEIGDIVPLSQESLDHLHGLLERGNAVTLACDAEKVAHLINKTRPDLIATVVTSRHVQLQRSCDPVQPVAKRAARNADRIVSMQLDGGQIVKAARDDTARRDPSSDDVCRHGELVHACDSCHAEQGRIAAGRCRHAGCPFPALYPSGQCTEHEHPARGPDVSPPGTRDE